ncbi:YjeF family domain-containing protein [Lichtheimia ornata]|uniref:ATP-dependent (S)-NAD(P)H-hydrate dehydratase n=1 Tax=Lichtheimia ornata TaxID=688661 RepID=A0AAD7XWU4_9FUNG|nr:YjeF family domain-containing protein [Lichtheimia ornata]KAJ8660064.1 YjeF family domain-containing protein [Lichtheimia ornata]
MPSRIPDINKVRQLIPPLSSEMHKGQAGRVGVVGGSEDYTGAPFFSAISAMRLGADLCHVFCEPGAGTVIKSYSPDLIVHPYMRTSDKKDASVDNIVKRVTDTFGRLHVLVVGPGLSRDDAMQNSAREIMLKAREQNMAIVVDADGLFLVQNHPETVKDYAKAVLTPNVVEFKRLCERMDVNSKEHDQDTVAYKLSQAFGGVTIVQKGPVDLITNGKEVLRCETEGGLRRVGGQGDILSGTIATFLAWGKGYEDGVWKHSNEIESKDIAMLASWGACCVTRDSSKRAFEKYGRAMLTSQMVEEIGAAYAKFAENK